MPKLTLRDYSAGFLLLSFSLASVVAFSSGVFNSYDAQLKGEQEEIKQLNKQIDKTGPDTGTGQEKANSISIVDSSGFLLGSILTVIETATRSIGSLPSIGEMVIKKLNISGSVLVLFSIPVVAVIWEVVSLYRGIRT